MPGVLTLKPEVSALGSSTLSGALLSSRPPEHEDALWHVFYIPQHCTELAGLPYSLLQDSRLQDEVQSI